jgi:hypothetical protein
MKRFLLLFIFLTGSILFAAAQSMPQTSDPEGPRVIQAHNWFLGTSAGNIGFNFKSNNFQFNLAPQVGYFISDNALIGAQSQIGLAVYEGGETFSWGITPFVRYYFPEGARTAGRFFGEAIIGLGGSSTQASREDAIFDVVGGLGIGYAHFIARNVALEGILGYTNTSADIVSGERTAGLSLGIGFGIYLPGRRNR